MTVTVEIVRDLDSGVTTVRVDGELTFASAPEVRTALNKCASECPTAVIVDLTGLEVARPGRTPYLITRVGCSNLIHQP